MEATFKGYCEKIPFKRGGDVLIPKNVRVVSTRPKNKEYLTKRAYRVTVNHILPGHDATGCEYPACNPRIVWAGAGGYWCMADINDLLAANPSKEI